jgi:hypothetical protein
MANPPYPSRGSHRQTTFKTASKTPFKVGPEIRLTNRPKVVLKGRFWPFKTTLQKHPSIKPSRFELKQGGKIGFGRNSTGSLKT